MSIWAERDTGSGGLPCWLRGGDHDAKRETPAPVPREEANNVQASRDGVEGEKGHGAREIDSVVRVTIEIEHAAE